MICDTSPRINRGRAGLPAAEIKSLTALYRKLGSHYKVAAATGRTPQSAWQILKRRGVINPKKRKPGVLFKGEKFTPDRQGFMRSTTFASRRKGCTRLLHRVVWEERHGKIKKRERKTHMFLFRDGNRANCALSNLRWLNRKEAAKFRAWNGNGYTKWRERHDELTRALKILERGGAAPEEIEKARLALESQPPWKGNGDPKKRRRSMLRRWARRTPERRLEIIARAQLSKRERRRERYAALPEYALAMLPEREQEVLRRHLRDGETTRQIAASMGCVCVHHIVARALKKIPTFAKVLEKRVDGVKLWIFKEANRVAFRFRGVEKADLVQEGFKSAFEAAKKFDPGIGISFLGYCKKGIGWSMSRYVRETSKSVRVPAQKFFTHSVSMVSMDEQGGEDSHATICDLFCSEEESTTAALDDEDRAEILRELLARLNGQEQEVLRRRFFEHESLGVIDADMGVCRERIRQIEAKALRRPRKMPQLGKLKEAA